MGSNRGLTGICVALALTILGACGGGGGGDNSTGGGSNGGNNSTGTPPSNNDPNAPVAVSVVYVAGPGVTTSGYTTNISGYTIDETTGALSEIPGSPFASDIGTRYMVVTPSGKFAYAVNNAFQVNGTILTLNVQAYSIDMTTGALTRVGDPVELQGIPRSIAMHPSGRAIFVALDPQNPADQVGNGPRIAGFAIDAATGVLSSIGSTPLYGRPSNITIDPSGRFAYVSQQGEDSARPNGIISAYAIDSTTGAMSEIAGSPYATSDWALFFAMLPSGRFLYTAGGETKAYAIDGTTGALSALPGNPLSPSQVVWGQETGRFIYGEETVDDPQHPDSITYAINESTGALSKVGSNGHGVGYALAFSPSKKFVFGVGSGIRVNTVNPSTGMLTNVANYDYISPFIAFTTIHR
jgi:6-phosphogluconolactonase